MKRRLLSLTGLVLSLSLSTLFVGAQAAPQRNLREGCVENYAPDINYFPEQVSFDYAEGLTVEYFNNYKIVTVPTPWRDADVSFQYVLLQCGTPAPEGYDQAQIITVPVSRVVNMSTTYLPHFDKLGLVDTIIGLDEFDFVNTVSIREQIDAGSLVEVGSGPGLNVELVLELETDLVLSFGIGGNFDSHPVLLDAGVPVALGADYLESSPLARAEWIKFTALFFNREADAEIIFTDTAANYETLIELAASVPESERPTVLTNTFSSFSEAWNVSGASSYIANLITDAGAEYIFPDVAGTGSVPYDFEYVYENALDADFWITNTFAWYSSNDILAADERYADFAAFQNGNTYNTNARENEFGGSDYFETGAANPDQLLADLIAIFHPELLPDHDLMFYLKLSENDN